MLAIMMTVENGRAFDVLPANMIMYMPQTRLQAQPTSRNVRVKNCIVPTMRLTQHTVMDLCSREGIRLLPQQNTDSPDNIVPIHSSTSYSYTDLHMQLLDEQLSTRLFWFFRLRKRNVCVLDSSRGVAIVALFYAVIEFIACNDKR